MRSNEERFPPALAVGENHLLLRDALRYVGGYPEFPKQFPIGSLLRTNSFALTSPAFDNIGTAMDLVVANTNHSCEPNAYAIMNGPKIALRTLRPISKDEEIFINYVDVTEPFSMRRVELRGMYFFDCTCTKCKRGPKEKEDKFHRAPTALEKKLFNDLSVPRDGLEEARNSLGKGPELALLAIAQSAFRQSADIAITDVPSAVEKYHNLRTVQRTWANLDLWPQHRYPWPKIYNDILLATLDLESYYLALVFAAKIYLDVDPILYPQEHAPLRVVHTWRLLLLLVLFADKRKPTPRPADVHLNHGILITGLLYDLIVQVPKSHGTDTRFYKIVASKHEEITKPFGEATTRAYRSELDATVAAQMGDAVKGLRDLVDKVLEPEQRQPGDSYLRGCYEYLQAEAKVPFEERSEPILRSDE
jgi:SET and MYND domain-containing protein